MSKTGKLTAHEPALFRCRPEMVRGISLFIRRAHGSTACRKKVRTSCSSISTPAKGTLSPRQTIQFAAGFAGTNFCSELMVSMDGSFIIMPPIACMTASPASLRPDTGRSPLPPNEWTPRRLPTQLQLRSQWHDAVFLQPAVGQSGRFPSGPRHGQTHIYRPDHARGKSFGDPLCGPGQAALTVGRHATACAWRPPGKPVLLIAYP